MASQSVQQFIDRLNIRISAEWADHNPNMDDDGSRGMDHWRVTLRMGAKRMRTYFSKGYAHNGAPPTAAEVLDCLASDAATVDNAAGFEDWAGELGYDPDSRRAERTYRTTERQTLRLCSFLGGDEFQNLLWHTERE